MNKRRYILTLESADHRDDARLAKWLKQGARQHSLKCVDCRTETVQERKQAEKETEDDRKARWEKVAAILRQAEEKPKQPECPAEWGLS